MYRQFGKRLMDIVLSFAALTVLSPLLLTLIFVVHCKLGSPVIFKQQRPGKNEKIFTLYKFRTMTHQKDGSGNLLSDEFRLTSFGRWLRSTSLDELPELWNILRGDMSIVGPRPLLIKYLPYYTCEERKRHLVRPGLTGLAQVNGRNLLNWDLRLKMDVQYVESVSIKNDIAIILTTVLKSIARSDIVMGNTHIMLDLDQERRECIECSAIDSV